MKILLPYRFTRENLIKSLLPRYKNEKPELRKIIIHEKDTQDIVYCWIEEIYKLDGYDARYSIEIDSEKQISLYIKLTDLIDGLLTKEIISIKDIVVNIPYNENWIYREIHITIQ